MARRREWRGGAGAARACGARAPVVSRDHVGERRRRVSGRWGGEAAQPSASVNEASMDQSISEIQKKIC